MGGTRQSTIKANIPCESTRQPFSLKFIISLKRLINLKRNAVLREGGIVASCGGQDKIFYLNAILDLHEIFVKFELEKQQRASDRVGGGSGRSGGAAFLGSLRPQTIYDYLFTLNKIKLDLENFPKQFASNPLYQQLFQFCAPINLNHFIDLFDLQEIRAYVHRESNQQIKEHLFNSYFMHPHEEGLHDSSRPPFYLLRRFSIPESHSISSKSTVCE